MPRLFTALVSLIALHAHAQQTSPQTIYELLNVQSTPCKPATTVPPSPELSTVIGYEDRPFGSSDTKRDANSIINYTAQIAAYLQAHPPLLPKGRKVFEFTYDINRQHAEIYEGRQISFL